MVTVKSRLTNILMTDTLLAMTSPILILAQDNS